MKKICNICGIEKDINDFYKRKKSKDGYRNDCKECHNEQRKELYFKKRDYEKERRKKHYECNKDIINAKRREQHKINKEKDNAKSKEYRDKNKEKFNEYARQYRKKHQKEITAKRKEKRHNDEKYYFEIYLRNKINNYLYRYGKIKKKNNVQEILGCNFEEFKSYIESKFQNGMSWENRGEWHLDHIIPLATAKNYNDLIKLNHYTNFQPLWAKDNLSKGKRLVVNNYENNGEANLLC